jgi:hypothetical protein
LIKNPAKIYIFLSDRYTYELIRQICNQNQALPYNQEKTPMKTLRFLMIVLLFTAFSAESYALIDDCPCRRRVVKKIVKVKQIVYKVHVQRFGIFDEIPWVPEDFGCRRPGIQQVVSYQLKVMPNPVQKRLNVISYLEYSGTVKIELFTCEGKLITTLMNEYWESGTNVRTFDLEGKVKRGIAYVRLTAGTVRQVEKIFVL